MLKIKVTLQYSVSGHGDLNKQTDELMQTLLAAEDTDQRLSDVDVFTVINQNLVDIVVSVEAATWTEAEELGKQVITSAIRKTGGHVVDAVTPSFAGSDDSMNVSLQSTELVPA